MLHYSLLVIFSKTKKMTSILLRYMFLIYKLLNSCFLYFVPTKLKPSTTTTTTPPPHHRPDELRRVFDMFDKNRDGKISQSELGNSLEQLGIPVMGPNELGPMISRLDLDGDGYVDIKEFETFYESMAEEREMREAFEVFDRDGDGFICAEELRTVLGAMGIEQGKCAEQCRKMIMTVDVDGDERVDFVEFKRMMTGVGLTNDPVV